MLKRVGHILIILLLLFGTTGLTITKHYCGSNLIKTEIFSTPDNCCNGNCPGCHNEKVSFRITDQFENAQAHVNFYEDVQTLLEKISLPVLLAFSNAPEVSLFNDGPGGTYLKPSSTKSICAGPNTSFLQVFLF